MLGTIPIEILYRRQLPLWNLHRAAALSSLTRGLRHGRKYLVLADLRLGRYLRNLRHEPVASIALCVGTVRRLADLVHPRRYSRAARFRVAHSLTTKRGRSFPRNRVGMLTANPSACR